MFPLTDPVKKLALIYVLFACVLVSCKTNDQPHEHTPDDADCQHVQYCSDCGEQLAAQGPHDYSEHPQAEYEDYVFFICRVCGETEIVNKDGNLVVPVE